jgi:hypothetical protein
VATCATSQQPSRQSKPKTQPTPQPHEEVVTPKNTPQQQLTKNHATEPNKPKHEKR